MQFCNGIMKSFLQPLEFQSYTAGSNKCKVEICEVSGLLLAATIAKLFTILYKGSISNHG